jgi:hypothetical protein
MAMKCGLCKQAIRGDEGYTVDHYSCQTALTESFNADIRKAEAQRDALLVALKELHALVWGECSSLLNEDSGGDGRLDMAIRAAIALVEKGEGR